MPFAPLFTSVLCGTGNGALGVAAARQAAWLADPEGTVELVPARALTGHGPAALADRCGGHDLLVLGSEDPAHAVIRRAPIPALLARWCPAGRDVTDEILVAVAGHAGCERAAEIAARIACRHRGSVSVVAAPGRSPELSHALAVANRVVLRTAGHTPRMVAETAPPEIAVPWAAAETGASLLVIGVGDDGWDTRLASDVARRTGCSVLTVPTPAPVARRFRRTVAGGVLVPA